MSAETCFRLLAGLGVASVAVMVWAASLTIPALSLSAAAAFAAGVVAVSVFANVGAWRGNGPARPDEVRKASHTNTVLMALAFGWGALAMAGVYTLSGMWWWHSWQYGLIMLAIALVLLVIARFIHAPTQLDADGLRLLDLGAVLALVQGLAAAGGLAFLLGSGKPFLLRPDWPANHIFLAGGAAVCALSLLAAATHFVLRSRR